MARPVVSLFLSSQKTGFAKGSRYPKNSKVRAAWYRA
jgi:hypothetical protein